MADSIRKQIISALDTRLKTITLVNHYKTNLGSNVKHFLTENIAEASCPALIYSDQTDSSELESFAEMMHTMALKVDLKYAVSTISGVYDGIEDVLAAIGTDDTFGGLVMGATPIGNEMSVDGEGQTIIITASININLQYLSDRWTL